LFPLGGPFAAVLFAAAGVGAGGEPLDDAPDDGAPREARYAALFGLSWLAWLFAFARELVPRPFMVSSFRA